MADVAVTVANKHYQVTAAAPIVFLSPDLAKFGSLHSLSQKRNAQVKSAFALAALPNVAAIAAAVFFNTPALISVIMTTLGAVTYYRQASRVLRQASGGSAELPFLRKRSEADGASEPLLAPGFWLLAPSLDDRELVPDVQLWPPPWSPVLNA
jgi:hypothetical protein